MKAQENIAFDFTAKPKPMRFNGSDYERQEDDERLTKQHERIRDLMLDNRWRSLGEIESLTGYPAASISAQLRHLRKERFGAYVVEKRARGERSHGLFEYRVSKPILGEDGKPIARPKLSDRVAELERVVGELCEKLGGLGREQR